MTEQIQQYVSQSIPPITTAPRLKLGEYGFVGLKMTNGWIMEESRRDLRWPWSTQTFKQMAMDAVIASAIAVYEMQIARVGWYVKPHPDATDEEKRRAKIIQTMMDDMEHSWFDFIREVTSMYTFGYCVNEKVYRKRTYSNGSRFNDNYIGIKKLPVRSQDTISRWLWSEDSRDLVAVEQTFTYVDTFKTSNAVPYKVTIPRNKILLFRTNAKRNNPQGTSPLKSCYIAWKIKSALEEHEAIGISRDMRGMPVLEIPPRYMSADATDEEKAVKRKRHI